MAEKKSEKEVQRMDAELHKLKGLTKLYQVNLEEANALVKRQAAEIVQLKKRLDAYDRHGHAATAQRMQQSHALESTYRKTLVIKSNELANLTVQMHQQENEAKLRMKEKEDEIKKLKIRVTEVEGLLQTYQSGCISILTGSFNALADNIFDRQLNYDHAKDQFEQRFVEMMRKNCPPNIIGKRTF